MKCHDLQYKKGTENPISEGEKQDEKKIYK